MAGVIRARCGEWVFSVTCAAAAEKKDIPALVKRITTPVEGDDLEVVELLASPQSVLFIGWVDDGPKKEYGLSVYIGDIPYTERTLFTPEDVELWTIAATQGKAVPEEILKKPFITLPDGTVVCTLIAGEILFPQMLFSDKHVDYIVHLVGAVGEGIHPWLSSLQKAYVAHWNAPLISAVGDNNDESLHRVVYPRGMVSHD